MSSSSPIPFHVKCRAALLLCSNNENPINSLDETPLHEWVDLACYDHRIL